MTVLELAELPVRRAVCSLIAACMSVRFSPPGAGAPRSRQLPRRVARFVGRSDFLKCAQARLDQPGRSSAIAVFSRLCPGLLSALPLHLPANPQPRKVTAFCCSSPNTSQANLSPRQSRGAVRAACRLG